MKHSSALIKKACLKLAMTHTGKVLKIKQDESCSDCAIEQNLDLSNFQKMKSFTIQTHKESSDLWVTLIIIGSEQEER